jgi:2-amino-4-hydroxy-6-hydroxymethyldihydropteridine diphosphokinase
MSHKAYIALGTNLGDRLANLLSARQALPPDVRVLASSPIYKTPPWGVLDQPDFFNQVIQVETDLSPKKLLAHLKRLEVELGRVPSIRFGPRLIDMDILFFDDLCLDITGLTIPHPRLAERAFVLVPLADLAPELRHPCSGKTVAEMLAQIDASGISSLAEETGFSGKI